MKTCVRARALLLCLVPLLCGLVVGPCGLTAWDFVKVSENGFDASGVTDRNTYPWSMEYFEGNGAGKQGDGYVYVGTGNNILVLMEANLNVLVGEPFDPTEVIPPEIWRSRVNDDPPVWEKVLDYREVEPGPVFDTVGFRQMATYTPTTKNGATYLYTGTYGTNASLWRTASGDPGMWELVWETGIGGSIRSIQEHDGVLYFAPTEELSGELNPAELWATDGEDFWPVMQDGFGNPNNLGIACLNSWNGWLYAGLANFMDGAEVWKIRDAGSKSYVMGRVVANGGADPRNEIIGTTGVFGDHIYFGTLIFAGVDPLSGNGFKGADIIRIDADDNWETVVGENGLSGWDSGFDYPFNAYLWQLEEHDGWFYASTWDQSTALMAAVRELGLPAVIEQICALTSGELPSISLDPTSGFEPGLLDRLLHTGGDLYKSRDGINWCPVTTNGLGNRANYGIRTLTSVGGFLYLGFANPWDGLEMWRGRASRQ